MKKSFSYFSQLMIVCFLTLLSAGASAQTTLQYDFRGNLDEKNGLAPALNVVGTGQFTDESLPALSCLERTVYNFNQNSGVQFDNGAAGSVIGGSYTIELYFKFITNNGFMRIIDFKNRTSDFGLYATNSLLQFYDELTIGTNAFAANQYVHLVITRDDASDDVRLYINGSFVGTFNDSSGEAIPGAANLINFFQDDLVFGNEAQPGNIALLRIDNAAISDSLINVRFNTLETSSAVLAFSPNLSSTCLTGNLFSFTNQSSTTSTVTYNWEFGDGIGSSGLNANHSYLTDGLFTILLIADDGQGCSDSVAATVEVYLAPTVSLGADFDICDGSFALLDPGQSFSGYLWSDGSTDPVLAVNLAGTYTITVTDASGCTASSQIQIGVLQPPVVSLGADSVYCFGETVTISAPAGLFSYLWSTGETSADISVNVSGTYSVEVVDIDGCASSDSILIDYFPELTISLPLPPSICQGDIVLLDPGQNFASYLWSDLSTGTTLSVTTNGNYTVTVTDSNGCSATANASLIFEQLPVVNLGADQSLCGGSQVTLDAGSGFSTYLWSDGSSGQTLNVNAGGTYSVTVTLGGTCVGTDDIVITTEPFVSLGPDVTGCTGTDVTLDPGSGYITYLWSNGLTSQTINVNAGGVYTITVTDINGCLNSDEILVAFSPSPVVSLGSDIQTCDGDIVALNAGSGFFNYQWSTGSAGEFIIVTTSGNYTVTVTDINGCTGSDTINVLFNSSPVVQLGNDTTVCNGTPVTLDAGAGFLSYSWSDGTFSQQTTVTLAGSYTVTVTNSNGCTNSDTINVGTLALPVVSLISDTTLCDGDSIFVDAGSGFSTYLWNDGSATQGIQVSAAGIYTVTVTDANSCEGSGQVQISYHPPQPIPTITQNGNTLISSSPSGNQWYSIPGGLIPGATGNTYEPGQNGTFYLVVTDTVTGCVSEPSFDYIFLFNGLADSGGMPIGLSPNPANSLITVNLGFVPVGEMLVQVADLSGKIVSSWSKEPRSAFTLDISELSQGIYYIRVVTRSGTGIGKVVVNR
jgi:hypothetical protein